MEREKPGYRGEEKGPHFSRMGEMVDQAVIKISSVFQDSGAWLWAIEEGPVGPS